MSHLSGNIFWRKVKNFIQFWPQKEFRLEYYIIINVPSFDQTLQGIELYLSIMAHDLKLVHPLQNLNCTRNWNEVLISALPSTVITVPKFLDSKGRTMPTFSLFVKLCCREKNNHVEGTTLENDYWSSLTMAGFLTMILSGCVIKGSYTQSPESTGKPQ